MIKLLLLSFISICCADPNCTNTTYDVFYFDKCIADTLCQKNYHLHSDEQWAFSRMMNNELLEPMQLTGDDICADQTMWMAVLRTFDVCFPNHRRDFDGICILNGDKLEDPSIWHRTGLAALTSHALNVGILIIVLWMAARQLDDWKTLQKKLEAKEEILSVAPKPVVSGPSGPTQIGQELIFNFDKRR